MMVPASNPRLQLEQAVRSPPPIEEGEEKKDPIFKKPLLFRRAKEYQREQLKQELKGELYSELSDKLDEDVAVATETLRKATEAKVASESKKLQNQAKTHQQRLTANAKALAAASNVLGAPRPNPNMLPRTPAENAFVRAFALPAAQRHEDPHL